MNGQSYERRLAVRPRISRHRRVQCPDCHTVNYGSFDSCKACLCRLPEEMDHRWSAKELMYPAVAIWIATVAVVLSLFYMRGS